VPWCSSFVNAVAWMLRLPRSKSARARSWLNVGYIPEEPRPGWDIVVMKRGINPHAGHVGFFAGCNLGDIQVLGGNQENNVTIRTFDSDLVLGYRSIKPIVGQPL
jgi:uncharacterized protein (TIGR02594 family)